MADKKNIVIKVKYPTSETISEEDALTPKTITEWNIKRIAIALGGLALLLSSLFYFFGNDKQPAEVQSPAVISENTGNGTEDKAATEANDPVVRAQLAYKVVDNEPADEITLPLKISKKGSTWIYYFVELKSMQGKTVYHEWLLDGELVSRKKVHISDETWRTASRQVFTYSTQNSWTVRLTDEAGNTLNEKHFDVIYE